MAARAAYLKRGRDGDRRSRAAPQIAAASGESAKAPPTKHMIDLPPRLGCGSGKAWPTIAPAAATYAGQ